MLQDGVTLVQGSVANLQGATTKGLSVEAGDTFPANPSNGQRFHLNVANAEYETGDYTYNATTQEWVNEMMLLARGGDFKQVGKKGSVPRLNPTTAVPYDIGTQILGKPDASAVVARFIAPRAFEIPQGMAGSIGRAGVNSTGAVVLSVRKNGVEFGTVTFAAGQANGTFAANAKASFAIGDIFTVVAPATADATFADAQMTFVANLA
jgi:hypothetical protein